LNGKSETGNGMTTVRNGKHRRKSGNRRRKSETGSVVGKKTGDAKNERKMTRDAGSRGGRCLLPLLLAAGIIEIATEGA
jgi:hypothetical protein